MDSFRGFFSLSKWASVVSCWEYLFLFFHLKEIPRTCQVYRLNVITEPGGKDLSIALVMCCSDHFSFQSKINYCFITRMSHGLHFIHLHGKNIHNSQEKLKIKLTKSLVPHFIASYLAWKVLYIYFSTCWRMSQLKRISVGSNGSHAILHKDLSTELKNAANPRAQRGADLLVTKPEEKLFRTLRAKLSQNFGDANIRWTAAVIGSFGLWRSGNNKSSR